MFTVETAGYALELDRPSSMDYADRCVLPSHSRRRFCADCDHPMSDQIVAASDYLREYSAFTGYVYPECPACGSWDYTSNERG